MPDAQRGGALLAVLWLAAALSAIAFSVANTVRTETERTGTASEGLRTYYLASGSVDHAILWMQWGMNGSPNYYKPPMPYLRYTYPSGAAVVEVIPEISKININFALPDQLTQILMACGADQFAASGIAAAIVDWRTAAPGAAPSVDFMNPNKTFRPRHASFQEIEDVMQVAGVTPDLFYGRFARDGGGRLTQLGGLRDAITIYGGQGNQVDVNSAPPVLLAGVGLPPPAIVAIVTRRVAKPFQSMGDVAQLIGSGPWMSKLQVASGTINIWTLRSTARLKKADGQLSDLSRTVSATIAFLPQQMSQQEPNFHFLRWRDDAAAVGAAALPF